MLSRLFAITLNAAPSSLSRYQGRTTVDHDRTMVGSQSEMRSRSDADQMWTRALLVAARVLARSTAGRLKLPEDSDR